MRGQAEMFPVLALGEAKCSSLPFPPLFNKTILHLLCDEEHDNACACHKASVMIITIEMSVSITVQFCFHEYAK